MKDQIDEDKGHGKPESAIKKDDIVANEVNELSKQRGRYDISNTGEKIIHSSISS